MTIYHWSILICTRDNPIRRVMFKALKAELFRQITEAGYTGKIEVVHDDTEGISIGQKRNKLVDQAWGTYVSFIDDDDTIGETYITDNMEGILKGVDCCSLVGEITTDGKSPRKFIHSLKYDSYFEDNGVYYRPPNHLNVVKKEYAEQVEFTDKNHGEDTDWAMELCKSGLLKTQHEIENTIYYYNFVPNKTY